MKCDSTNQIAFDSILDPDDLIYIKLPQDSKITSLFLLRPQDTPKETAKRGRGRPRKIVTLEEVKEPELVQKKLKSGTFKITYTTECKDTDCKGRDFKCKNCKATGCKRRDFKCKDCNDMDCQCRNCKCKKCKGRNCVYIEDYRERTAHSQGSYRLSTYKLLDFLIWQLDAANRLPDGERSMDSICMQLTLPLDFYIRCCGYDREITASKRKDAQKELQKELQLLCATLIGWNDGSAVRILDAGCARNGQIIVTFSDRMADHLLHNCYCMWYPLKLLQLNGKSLRAYSMGRSMALHSSIYNNQRKGTDKEYSVRRLLQYCCDLPTPEEVKTRNGNYRQAIIRPFTDALEKLAEMKLVGWGYRSLPPPPEEDDNSQADQTECAEFPEKYDDFRRDTVEYYMSGMPEGLLPIWADQRNAS